MSNRFEILFTELSSLSSKTRIAIAAAQDEEVLRCAIKCKEMEISDFILVGDKKEIDRILIDLGEIPEDWDVRHVISDTESAQTIVKLINSDEADLPMKGNLHTSTFLKAVLDKETGLMKPGELLSQITVFEYEDRDGFVLVTDCAINIEPDYDQKVKILMNAVELAISLGITCPKVAVITPVEVVNLKLPETIDAALLSKANERGQIKECIVDGPLAVDNALSTESAKIKKIDSKVAGCADILLMPNLSSGNAVDKIIRYVGKAESGSSVMGAKVPLIMTSRSDTVENRINTIALAATRFQVN